VVIPRDSLTVITGLSGPGKSALAFDTICTGGERLYVWSLSAYTRQFLGLMGKPGVDSIDGLSPAISIEQKTTPHNPPRTPVWPRATPWPARLDDERHRNRHRCEPDHSVLPSTVPGSGWYRSKRRRPGIRSRAREILENPR